MSRNQSAERTDLLNTSEINFTEKPLKSDLNLKHHYPAIWLIILYIPLVIVPWVTTVILAFRPISKSTYYYQEGFDLKEYKRMQSWVTAIDVLNSIAGLLAVPVVSFVIAQTAVVFSQKRAPTRQLSVRDIFAFADRAWTDISVLFKLITAKGHGSRAFNGFIALASGLLLISALQPPLYQVLVDWESINIPSGLLERIQIDPSLHELRYDKVFLGVDAEPALMESIPHATILQSVQFELPSIKKAVPEMYMWIDYNGTLPPASKIENPQGDGLNNFLNVRIREEPEYQNILPTFFAAFPFNITTGTKRYHAMRFNSTLECEPLSKDDFPMDCPGNKPYNTSIEVRNTTSLSQLRICVPGTWGTSPWTLSRNRQDIEEEVYLQFLDDSDENASSTVRCSSATTRGFFELGNYRTNGAYGPLLEKWPSPDVIESEFNDEGSACTSGGASSCNTPYTYIPTEWDAIKDGRVRGWTPEKPEYMRWNVSGPLVTSVMALFGNESWISTAANLISSKGNSSNQEGSAPIWWKPFCERQPLYHSRITECDSDKTPSNTLARWLAASFPVNYTLEEFGFTELENLLFIGIALTNKAILLTHRDSQAPRNLYNSGGRRIYSSPGFSILKPNMSSASIGAISVLLAIQVAGLIFCSICIARTPTWTRTLNAMAIARIGSGLEKDKLPADGQYAQDEDYERLRVVEVPLRMASADAIRRRPKLTAETVEG